MNLSISKDSLADIHPTRNLGVGADTDFVDCHIFGKVPSCFKTSQVDRMLALQIPVLFIQEES